ncbi:MAG: TIGR00366 family protein, partial [Flavobacteriales bacterium]|nr:TIGR00366 family protein [Flavobacteriales bacterium]
VQGAINFFIPSGSGQAAITMPIMTPLSDLLGIGRQTAVLAYQLGDGLFNLIIPTSGVTMGVLAIAGIPFAQWIKWIWKLMVVSIILSAIFLALPTLGLVNW